MKNVPTIYVSARGSYSRNIHNKRDVARSWRASEKPRKKVDADSRQYTYVISGNSSLLREQAVE